MAEEKNKNLSRSLPTGIEGEQKIKVCHILPTLNRGGAERVVADLILNLDRERFAPSLILFQSGGAWLAEITAENIPVTILKKRGKFDPLNFWQIYRALKKIRPQIVHTHLGGDLYGRLAAKFLGVPVIISTEHNINTDERRIQNILKKISNRTASRIVAVSEAVKKDLTSRYDFPMEKVSVIMNGLDIEKFRPYLKNIEEGNTALSAKMPIFGTLGRLNPQKGHFILIEAWKKLKNDAICLIAGSGPLASALEEKIKREGLEEKVKLVGPTANPGAFLNSLDAFIFPSLWEGLGIVLLEAGLVGLPIVASDIDGIKEIINSETGWPIPAGRPEKLAEQIDWLISNLNNPIVKEKTERLRRRIISDFDIKKITAEYQALYLNLFNNKDK
jgi:glycosyltransferase involved in cell wall biosynthesis